jgi:hypothetical protein
MSDNKDVFNRGDTVSLEGFKLPDLETPSFRGFVVAADRQDVLVDGERRRVCAVSVVGKPGFELRLTEEWMHTNRSCRLVLTEKNKLSVAFSDFDAESGKINSMFYGL